MPAVAVWWLPAKSSVFSVGETGVTIAPSAVYRYLNIAKIRKPMRILESACGIALLSRGKIFKYALQCIPRGDIQVPSSPTANQKACVSKYDEQGLRLKNALEGVVTLRGTALMGAIKGGPLHLATTVLACVHATTVHYRVCPYFSVRVDVNTRLHS